VRTDDEQRANIGHTFPAPIDYRLLSVDSPVLVHKPRTMPGARESHVVGYKSNVLGLVPAVAFGQIQGCRHPDGRLNPCHEAMSRMPRRLPRGVAGGFLVWPSDVG
jgi:hypothetical protein